MGEFRVRKNSVRLQNEARRMRQEPTTAEAALWEALRGGKLDGLRFRRQHPVGRFVLDFYCPSHRLCIELDGSVHDEQQERDEARTAEIEAHGCRVIRFRNREVLTDLPSVLARIREEMAARD